MKLSFEQRRKIKNLYKLLLAGALLGPAYTIFSDGFQYLYPYVNALTIGVLLAITVFSLEFVIFTGTVKKLKFYKLFILRSCTYLISVASIIFFVFAISRSVRNNQSLVETINSATFRQYIVQEDFIIVLFYASFMIMAANFTFQMNRKLGYGILWSLVTGKYHRPLQTERIILFIKVSNAFKLMQSGETIRYHTFIKNFIFDITEIILFHKGEIYEYVEDEVVVLWAPEVGKEKLNCIQTVNEISAKMELLKDEYYSKFNMIPQIRCGIHTGKLTAGEIGDIKTQLVFQGDAMNTAYRILQSTSEQNPFLASEALISCMNLPNDYIEQVGEKQLKGKQQKTKLFALKSAMPENGIE